MVRDIPRIRQIQAAARSAGIDVSFGVEITVRTTWVRVRVKVKIKVRVRVKVKIRVRVRGLGLGPEQWRTAGTTCEL